MTKFIHLSLIIAITLTACGQEESKPVEKTYLQVAPVLDSPLTTDKFGEGTTIGLFVTNPEGGGNYNDCECSANVPAILHGTTWTLNRETEIINSGSVFAYCPYDKMVTSGKNIPVETASQTDYLYSNKADISKTAPVAELEMKHILSLIWFKIEESAGVTDLGSVTAVRLEKVGISGVTECGTGIIREVVTGDETYSQNGDIPCIVSVMAMPQLIGKVNTVFIIGGNEYRYEAIGNWESGKEITYSLSFDPETRTLLSASVTTIQDWAIGGRYDGDLTKPASTDKKI